MIYIKNKNEGVCLAQQRELSVKVAVVLFLLILWTNSVGKIERILPSMRSFFRLKVELNSGEGVSPDYVSLVSCGSSYYDSNLE